MIPNEEIGQFKPGQSGNPFGRPKKLPGLDKLMREVLGDGLAGAKEILEAIVLKAKRGNLKAAQIILNRAFGKETIPLSVEVEGVTPLIDYSKLSERTLKELLSATTLSNGEDVSI